MKSTSLRSGIAALTLLIVTLGSTPAQAPEDVPELSPALARRLIAQAEEVVESEIDVAYVLNGEKALKNGFSSRNASVAVYLVRQLEDGHRRRRCREQVFLYNSDFGWFLESVVEERHGDYLRIWSERKGYLEFR